MKIIKKHFTEIDSTNDFLLSQDIEPNQLWVVSADLQTKGRGQREKTWLSPSGGNLYLSLGWMTDDITKYADNFPEEIAINIKNILDKIINKKNFKKDLIRIKKPNDLYIDQQKLGGILVETKVKNNFLAKIVVGIGINLKNKIPGACALSDFGIDLNAEILREEIVLGINPWR